MSVHGRLKAFVENDRFERFIIVVIMINAALLGLETTEIGRGDLYPFLHVLDQLALAIFTVEIVLKMIVYGRDYPRDPWRIFDFIIVGISLVPVTQSFSALRALRVLRALRLMSMIPQMRKVVQALLAAIPGMGSVVALLSLVFYVFAVMATKLFGDHFTEWFGSIPASLYSLFQIMTLESWSMGIVRPVMEVYPLAWLFFVPFILITTFAVLNLFIAIIVEGMQSVHEPDQETLEADHRELLAEIKALRGDVADLKVRLKEPL
jgi:voltage-gated sodium channel